MPLFSSCGGREGVKVTRGPLSPPQPCPQGGLELTLTFFSISSRTLLCCSAMANVALCTRW